MLRKVLGKVDDGRFSRALAGMQAGWQWYCGERREHMLEGVVSYDGKSFDVSVRMNGRSPECRCGCRDAIYRHVICKHVAFAVMAEMACRG